MSTKTDLTVDEKALTVVPQDKPLTVEDILADADLAEALRERLDEEDDAASPYHAKYATRESWLQHFVEALRPWFRERANVELPEKVNVSVGWPSARALSGKNRRIGECWLPPGKTPHIFISPLMDDEIEILGVLVHELIHAMGIGGHKLDFKKIAVAVGLEGKMTATEISDVLEKHLRALLDEEAIGEMPHEKIHAEGRPIKKQTTRLLKVSCIDPDCGYIARVTRKWIEELGPPICPCNGESMEPEGL